MTELQGYMYTKSYDCDFNTVGEAVLPEDLLRDGLRSYLAVSRPTWAFTICVGIDCPTTIVYNVEAIKKCYKDTAGFQTIVRVELPHLLECDDPVEEDL